MCLFLSIDGVVAVLSSNELVRVVPAGVVTFLAACGMAWWIARNNREAASAPELKAIP